MEGAQLVETRNHTDSVAPISEAQSQNTPVAPKEPISPADPYNAISLPRAYNPSRTDCSSSQRRFRNGLTFIRNPYEP